MNSNKCNPILFCRSRGGWCPWSRLALTMLAMPTEGVRVFGVLAQEPLCSLLCCETPPYQLLLENVINQFQMRQCSTILHLGTRWETYQWYLTWCCVLIGHLKWSSVSRNRDRLKITKSCSIPLRCVQASAGKRQTTSTIRRRHSGSRMLSRPQSGERQQNLYDLSESFFPEKESARQRIQGGGEKPISGIWLEDVY